MQTGSFSIQVAVTAVNDAPVVIAPPQRTAVPGESTALPGFFVRDPDTDTDGKLAAPMLKVSKASLGARVKSSRCCRRRAVLANSDTARNCSQNRVASEEQSVMCVLQIKLSPSTNRIHGKLRCAGECGMLDGIPLAGERGAVWSGISRRLQQLSDDALHDRPAGRTHNILRTSIDLHCPSIL